MVPRQPGPCAFSGPVTILVCRDNEGAVGITRELKKAAGERLYRQRRDGNDPRCGGGARGSQRGPARGRPRVPALPEQQETSWRRARQERGARQDGVGY